MSHRPLFLLSNDDGYRARGIRALAEALRAIGDVVVCAPEAEQSTTSHSLTLTRPLRLRQVEEGQFAVDGTPADCVYVALNSGARVLPRTPDVVVAGLNHGLNLGTDVFYSGTVAAAREGALRGIPAMAASADMHSDLNEAAGACARLAKALVDLAPVSPERMSQGSASSFQLRVPAPLINVNVPPGRAWPMLATRLGLRLYEDLVEFRHDPRGREYLWIGGGGVRHENLAGSDTDAHDGGAISVTPLLLDLTAADGAILAQRLAAAGSGAPGARPSTRADTQLSLAFRAGFRQQCYMTLRGAPLTQSSSMAKAKGSVAKSSRKRAPARAAPTPRGVSARTLQPPLRVVVPATSVDTLAYVRALIRNVPDFPKPGVIFKDITPLLADPKGFHIVIDSLAERFIGEHIDAIVGIESRGFIFGSALAARLNASFVPVRKTGKLPAAVDRVSYDLEYGSAELEMHKHTIHEGAKVLVVDDLLATGGTASATAQLVRRQGGYVASFAFVLELDFLAGRERLMPVPVVSLIHYAMGE